MMIMIIMTRREHPTAIPAMAAVLRPPGGPSVIILFVVTSAEVVAPDVSHLTVLTEEVVHVLDVEVDALEEVLWTQVLVCSTPVVPCVEILVLPGVVWVLELTVSDVIPRVEVSLSVGSPGGALPPGDDTVGEVLLWSVVESSCLELEPLEVSSGGWDVPKEVLPVDEVTVPPSVEGSFVSPMELAVFSSPVVYTCTVPSLVWVYCSEVLDNVT